MKKTLLEKTIAMTHDTSFAARALTYLLFREVIEDAHSDYKISDSDIKQMCKQSVNRAALFLECLNDENRLAGLLSTQGVYISDWDDPEDTEDTEKLKRLIELALKEIREYDRSDKPRAKR